MIVSPTHPNTNLDPSIPKLLISSSYFPPPSQSTVFESEPAAIDDIIDQKSYGELYNETLMKEQTESIIKQKENEIKLHEKNEKRIKRESNKLRKKLLRMEQKQNKINLKNNQNNQNHNESHSEPATHRRHNYNNNNNNNPRYHHQQHNEHFNDNNINSEPLTPLITLEQSNNSSINDLLFNDNIDIRTIRSTMIDKQINDHRQSKQKFDNIPMNVNELYSDDSSSHYDDSNNNSDDDREEREYNDRNSAKKIFTNIDKNDNASSLWSKSSAQQTRKARYDDSNENHRHVSYDDDDRRISNHYQTPTRSQRRSPLRGRGYNASVNNYYESPLQTDVRSVWSSLSINHSSSPASESLWSKPSSKLRKGTNSQNHPSTSPSRSHRQHPSPMMLLTDFNKPAVASYSPFKPLLTHSTAIIQSNNSDDSDEDDNNSFIRNSSPMIHLSPSIMSENINNMKSNKFNTGIETTELFKELNNNNINSIKILSVKQIKDKWDNVFNDENDNINNDKSSIKSLNSIVRQSLLSSQGNNQFSLSPPFTATENEINNNDNNNETPVEKVIHEALTIQLHPAVEAELIRLKQRTVNNILPSSIASKNISSPEMIGTRAASLLYIDPKSNIKTQSTSATQTSNYSPIITTEQQLNSQSQPHAVINNPVIDRLSNDLISIKMNQSNQEEKILQRLEEIEKQVKQTQQQQQQPINYSDRFELSDRQLSPPPVPSSSSPFSLPLPLAIQNDLNEMSRQLNNLENVTQTLQHTLNIPMTPILTSTSSPPPAIIKNSSSPPVRKFSSPSMSAMNSNPSESQKLEIQQMLKKLHRAVSAPPQTQKLNNNNNNGNNTNNTRRSPASINRAQLVPVPLVRSQSVSKPVRSPTSSSQSSSFSSPPMKTLHSSSPQQLNSLKSKIKSSTPIKTNSSTNSRKTSIITKHNNKKVSGISDEESRLFAEAQSLIAQFRSEFPGGELKI